MEVDKEGAAHCTGIEHADEFFPRIEVEMRRRSREVGTLILVILGDGASWIWDRVADLAEAGQRVWHILDFWHACDHLVKIGKVLYGEGSEQFVTCYERWRSMLWQGCAAGVISELKDLHASGRHTEKQNHDIQGAINYFTTNQDRMKYPLYRAYGLPIGSGVVVMRTEGGLRWSISSLGVPLSPRSDRPSPPVPEREAGMESRTGEVPGPGRGVVDHRQFDSFRWRPREPRRYGRSERRPERRFLRLAGGYPDTTSARGGAL